MELIIWDVRQNFSTLKSLSTKERERESVVKLKNSEQIMYAMQSHSQWVEEGLLQARLFFLIGNADG